MERYISANKRLWDEKTKVHIRSEFYSVEEFKAGRSSLLELELKEVGDVKGKSMLHLQCHFGLDTLSWARRGALVTGVDFSGEAIAAAKKLKEELNIPAQFICTDIYRLPEFLTEEFDIVFTSYGVLCWLPDLKEWARVIARFLKRGGFFYIIDGHPLNNVFENEGNISDLEVKYSYFHSPEPARWEMGVTYADQSVEIKNPAFEWTHSLADIINALIEAGLTIAFLHEFPFCFYKHFPFMEQDDRGWWHLKGVGAKMPLLFSLKARKK